MLTIKNIGELIGHKFIEPHLESAYEVIDISTTEIDYPNSYSIQLGRFSTIYDPMTFSPHKRLISTKTIILNRMAFKGVYRMHNINDVTNSLRLDISLMDTKEKLIAAIKFIM